LYKGGFAAPRIAGNENVHFYLGMILGPSSALFVKFCSASLATQKRLASLNRKKGDEEQAQVVVYSFKI
jgi:hypothetical protein